MFSWQTCSKLVIKYLSRTESNSGIFAEVRVKVLLMKVTQVKVKSTDNFTF